MGSPSGGKNLLGVIFLLQSDYAAGVKIVQDSRKPNAFMINLCAGHPETIYNYVVEVLVNQNQILKPFLNYFITIFSKCTLVGDPA